MKDKIVIVDDDVAMLELVEDSLKKKGYDVVCYNNSTGVIENIRKVLPSLIMLDIHMPEKNGIEILKEIKRDPVMKNIPVVMLTVEGNPSEIDLSMLYGANTYILKPAKIEEIVKVIKSVLVS